MVLPNRLAMLADAVPGEEVDASSPSVVGLQSSAQSVPSPAKLHLNLKAVYFDQIRAGTKEFEFRQKTSYWNLRLVGKSFAGIVLKKGYPKSGDMERTIERPWRGFESRNIVHPQFGDSPVEVFAIRVN